MITRCTAIWSRVRRALSPTQWFVRWLRLPRADTGGQQRGLLLVQIDGLSRKQLERAVANGRMPFLASLLKREHYTLHDLYSGLPSSTPGVQGELFYGPRCAVPAFGFRNHRNGRIEKMFSRDATSEVQRALERQGRGVLQGGSAYCNIYGGGADETHFCASSLGWDEVITAARPYRLAVLLLWHFGSVVKTLGLVLLELVLALGGFFRGTLSGREYWQELMMVPARVVVVILLRELTTIGASLDLARGLPVVQLNLLGYDEQAHRRGPASAFAHWTLKGIDRVIRRLARAAHHSGLREYDLWIFSDHGQEATTPYEYVAGGRLQQAVSGVVAQVCGDESTNPSGSCGTTPETRSERSGANSNRAQWIGASWLVGKLFGEEGRDDSDPDQVQVAAVGPLGLIYTNRAPSEEARCEIAARLVRDCSIPLAFVALGDTAVAFTSAGRFDLKESAEAVFGSHPFLPDIAQDMVRLCQHPDAGDVVISGWVRDGDSLSFALQNGAHAGPGPQETGAFAMMPNDVQVIRSRRTYLRPGDLRKTISHFLTSQSDVASARHFPRSPSSIKDVRYLHVMTYNVHACIGMDGQLAPHRIARIIAQSQADVVALQELDVGRFRTGNHDQAQDIARYLEMECHFHPAWALEEEQYGDAILSRYPMRMVQRGALPSRKTNREPRGVLWVEIDLGAGLLVQVLNTHLSIYPAERHQQAEALLSKWISRAKRRGPTVVCGDFNAQPSSASYRCLAKALQDVQTYDPRISPARTWFSPRPLARIDHIFSTMDFVVQRAGVVDSRLARSASDHLPLVATLMIRDGGSESGAGLRGDHNATLARRPSSIDS